MNKYTFINGRLIYTPFCHACGIKSSDYDIAVRVIIFDNLKVIYIRINDFSVFQGFEYKQVQYKFNSNLRVCESYLKRQYKKHKIYNSYSINELPLQTQKDILNA